VAYITTFSWIKAPTLLLRINLPIRKWPSYCWTTTTIRERIWSRSLRGIQLSRRSLTSLRKTRTTSLELLIPRA
jgi:hypothetical protein